MGKLREPAKCLSPVFKEIWLILTFNIFWCIVCAWMSHSQQKNIGSIFVQVHSSEPVHFLFFTHLQHLYLMKCILFHRRWRISVADQVSLETVGLIAISLSRLPTLMHHHHLLYPVWQQFYWSISLSTVFLLLGVQVSLYNVEYARQGKKTQGDLWPHSTLCMFGFYTMQLDCFGLLTLNLSTLKQGTKRQIVCSLTTENTTQRKLKDVMISYDAYKAI